MKRFLIGIMAIAASLSAGAAYIATPAAGTGGGLSWTLGQTAADTFVSADGSVILSQGIFAAPEGSLAAVGEIIAYDETRINVEGNTVTLDGVSVWSLNDMAGRTLYQGCGDTFSIESFPIGIYIITAENADGLRSFKKILKQ